MIRSHTRTLLAVCAIALPIPAAIAGCGGDDGGGGGGEDPQTVLDDTFNNDETVTSGNIDITVEASAEGDAGGSFTASLSGPFQGDADDPAALPQLDWTGSVKADGAGQSIDGSAEITVTDDNAYVTYNDQAYEVGADSFADLKKQMEAQTPDTGGDTGSFSDRFKQGCEDAIEQQGGDASACDFDVAAWFSDLSNDGTEDVEGTESTKISGAVDVEQMLNDLFTLGSSVPGANSSGLSPDVIQAQLGSLSDAVDDASFDIYSGNDDNILRKLTFNIDVDPSAIPGASEQGVGAINLAFDVTLSDVNEEQTITAPEDAKPIEDLQSELGAIPGLGGSIPGLGASGASIPDSSGAAPSGGASDPEAAQKYLDCISKAGDDPSSINDCTALLQ